MEVLNRYAQLNVLLADDDEEMCELIKDYLSKTGLVRSMIVVHDGLSAATKLRNQKFDLILLDMVMPKKNGYELLEDFVADKLNVNSTEKVLAMSGTMDKKIFTIATGHGVRNFLIKPFDEDVFLQKISNIITVKAS